MMTFREVIGGGANVITRVLTGESSNNHSLREKAIQFPQHHRQYTLLCVIAFIYLLFHLFAD